ncbi:hypothetical protein NYA30BAC_01362 [Halomonas sp. NYA30]
MFISARQHFYQRFSPIDNRSHAATFSLIELVAADIMPLADALPIVIPRQPGKLPLALVTPTETHDPFAGHTPHLWQNYPFSLVTESLGIDSEGKPIVYDAVWVEPNTSHWSNNSGYRMFNNTGEPTEYLCDVMLRLRKLQQEIERTHALVALLTRADALVARRIEHLGQPLDVYQVSMEGLAERLEALDSTLAGKAMMMADRIAVSQENLSFTTPNRYGDDDEEFQKQSSCL